MHTIMIKYPIGIDMSANYLAAVQLQRKQGGSAIRAFVHHEFEDGQADAGQGDDARLASLLRDIAKDRAFSGRHVVLSIPTQHLSIFPLVIQVGKQETLEEAILRESEKYLPFPVEEAVIDYPCLTRESEADPDRYKATIVAARQSVIGAYLALLTRAGFVIDAIDSSVSALLRLHQSFHTMTENPVILCHMGPVKTLIAAVTRDGIIIQTTVTWGSRRLVSRILSDIDLSNDRGSAYVLLKKYGVGEGVTSGPAGRDPGGETDDVGKTIFRILVPSFDEIQYELHKIISYVRSEEQNPVFDGLFLYGDALHIHRLDRYLEQRMDMPATMVDPAAAMTNGHNQVPPGHSAEGTVALALGLAMRRVPWL